MLEIIKEIGAFAGLAAFFGVAVLALLSFTQGRDLRRLRDWAGSAPERDADRKEATSAAASERAEEIRNLEEARTKEREAAELRETRRERREAGLPELTWRERLRLSFSGGRSRMAEPSFLVAVFLIFVLVAAGVAYAVTGGFGGGDASGGNGGKQARTVHPAEIEVAVLNGTAVEGLAGELGDRVEAHGFELGKVTNTNSAQEESVVMFRPQNGRAAHKVGAALGISDVRPMTAEVVRLGAGAPVAVVVGEDNASSVG